MPWQMRFSAFIESNLDQLIAQWRSFARSISPGTEGMPNLALEDHVREMLLAIVKDMETTQTAEQRSIKSKGKAPRPSPLPETAAWAHGVTRHLSGYDLNELVSEFRALRASVLALWRESDAARSSGTAVEEIARFNEGIDQALTESIRSYSVKVGESRDMFLAVLGHDVRGPLSSIKMAADVLELSVVTDSVRKQTALRVRRAADVISRLTTDLLEYARSRLGSSIPIERSNCDLLAICEEAVDALKSAHPEQAIHTEFAGDLRARCDAARIQQALGNLLNNAVQHGDSSRPISLAARREDGAVVLVVANHGQPIPRESFDRIFEPLQRLPPQRNETFEQRSRVGLGLFIVKQIVEGHGGSVSVESSAESTSFTVRLPDAPQEA